MNVFNVIRYAFTKFSAKNHACFVQCSEILSKTCAIWLFLFCVRHISFTLHQHHTTIKCTSLQPAPVHFQLIFSPQKPFMFWKLMRSMECIKSCYNATTPRDLKEENDCMERNFLWNKSSGKETVEIEQGTLNTLTFRSRVWSLFRQSFRIISFHW